VAEVFANVGGEHRAHAELFGGEVARDTADVKCGDDGRDCIPAIFERAVRLRKKAGDKAGESVACAGGAESGVACRVDEHAPVRCGNEWARAFEDQYHVMSSRKRTRGRNSIA